MTERINGQGSLRGCSHIFIIANDTNSIADFDSVPALDTDAKLMLLKILIYFSSM